MDNENIAKRGGIYIILNLTGELQGANEDLFARNAKRRHLAYNKEHPFVYVGQAKDFSKRTHLESLASGKDSSKRLQQCFDKLEENGRDELVFFPIVYVDLTEALKSDGKLDNKRARQILDPYEKLCMKWMNEHGYNLYNIQSWGTLDCAMKDDCDISDSEIKNYEDELLPAVEKDPERLRIMIQCRRSLEKQFVVRFGKGPAELAQMSRGERKKSLEQYVKIRLNYADNRTKCWKQKDVEELKKGWEPYKLDRFVFSEDWLRKNCFINKETNNPGQDFFSVSDKNKLFFSKAGNYISEGVDQIVRYESRTIANHGFCLWSFATNAIAKSIVQELREAAASDDEELYVIFSLTYSESYSSKQEYSHRLLNKEDVKALDSLFLGEGSTKEVVRKEYEAFRNKLEPNGDALRIPIYMDSTAAGENSCKAFVISNLYPLKDAFTVDSLVGNYEALKERVRNMNGEIETTYDMRTFSQRGTFCLRKREGATAKLSDCTEENSRRTVSFLAKLQAPYVVELCRESDT